MPDRLLRAALLIPNPHLTECLLREAAALAAMHEWHLQEVVRRWDDMLAALLAGDVDIGIVDSRRRLPPDRIPRVEALDDQRRRPVPAQRRRSRRARRLPGQPG